MPRTRLAAPRELALWPLSWGLERPPWSDSVTIDRVDDTRPLVARLAARELDGALLPAHEIAHLAARYEIVPGLAACTRGPGGPFRLEYTGRLEDVRRIRSRAPGHAAEILAAILFAANGTRLEFIEDVPDDGIRPGDAALLAGDASFREPSADPGRASLDLGEAWHALTGLPFVWALWAMWPGVVDKKLYGTLHTARTRGRHAYGKEIHRFAAEHGVSPAHLESELERGVRFRLGNDELAGLERFWEEGARLGLLPGSGRPNLVSFSSGGGCAALD